MTLDVGISTVIAAAIILFLAAIVRGTTGFGYALAATPFLLIFWEPAFIVPVFVPLAVVGDVLIIMSTWRLIVWKQVIPLAIAGVACAPLGGYLLTVIPPDGLRLLVAGLALVSGIILLRGIIIPIRHETLASLAAGSLSGLFSTSTTISGPPVALLLINQRLEKQKFRASLAMYFFLLQLTGSISLAFLGPLDRGTLTVTALLLPTVFLGNLIGLKLAKRLPQDLFRKIVTLLVIITAALVIIQTMVN
jgi:uncharacterized membrane protein YfcA